MKAREVALWIVIAAQMAGLVWLARRVTRVETYQRERVAEWQRAMTRWDEAERGTAEVVGRLTSTLDAVEEELRLARLERERRDTE